MNLRKTLLIIAGLLTGLAATAEERSFSSPDGRIQVTVSDSDGSPFLMQSPLGLTTSIGDFTEGLAMLPEKDGNECIRTAASR